MFKYESIYNNIKDRIQMADLQAGEKLPSIRDLSQQFTCSKSTILTALNKLEDQHLIYAIPKSGYYVVDHQMPHKPSTTDFIDFATSSPTWHAFPYKDFQHCMNKAIDTYQEELFHYGTPNGLPSLIDEARKLLETYQIFTHSNHIFVTSGVQQALAILSLMPFPNHRKTLLVEQPSYHLYMDFIKAYKLPVIGIRRTINGIDLEELEQIFRSHDIKFFYTMPRFHNPLGTSYRKKEKEAILSLAARYDVYIVEDDYLADFEQNTKVDPLFSYDTHNHVIYLKSFSKIMFPGLRIGFAVLPPLLTPLFQRYKKTTDIDSSMISQAALELYIKSGMFNHYRARVSGTYAARANILQYALKKHLSVYQSPSEICMHSHIVLPKRVNLNLLISHLNQHKVLLETIDGNYLDGVLNERILKLNISNIEEYKIEEGIKEIAIALNNSKNYF
ncbi:aminotransferase-like domain-containing protein [Priestia endophytica]|jgi:DNA-binding transcriptional MocR family regulator|uniref:aminotransferase-like domain-containing protein n=1 Tax=Priestia endophytica TaxID=135735 RepID=UPI000F53515C|nr:PLP-dependent aminotransferase family protein [Priestia endophytica]MED4073937.1 PLP-dependent aminotransferase family protein [Priestia endophytica]RPK06055.1 Transcriptional regulator, GntR family domain [Priestia endophytica]